MPPTWPRASSPAPGSLKGTVIPDGVEFTVTRNYGETATDKAQKLIGKLVFATAFVVLLVLFALGRREAVIVGAAVTLTLAATLFASWAWGFTLNRVSLFALIFSHRHPRRRRHRRGREHPSLAHAVPGQEALARSFPARSTRSAGRPSSRPSP